MSKSQKKKRRRQAPSKTETRTEPQVIRSDVDAETDRSDSGRVSDARWHWLAVGLLFALTLIAFLQVRDFEFLGYDDPIYIGDWPTSKIIQEGITAEGLKWVWTAHEVSLWEPLSYLSHMMDVQLFGFGPESGGDHHLANLGLHMANVLLVYLLTVLLFRKPAVALVTAGLFGLHPMRAESVGWVSERKGLLCAFFMLLALCSYVGYARKDKAGLRSSPWMWTSVLMTVLAMMSKPAAFVIPLLIGLLDIYPLRRCGFETDDWKWWGMMARQLREKWMFVAAAVFLTLVSLSIQYGSHTEKFIGASSWYRRLSLIPSVLMFYLQRSFVPQRLNFEYPPPDTQYYVLGAVVFAFGFTWFALENYRRRPGLFFAWGWFLATLFPVCGIVYVGTSFTTDRYTYFSHIGLFMGLAVYVSSCLEGDSGWIRRGVAAALGIVLLVGCTALAERQTGVWKNNFRLFSHAVKAQPQMNTGYTNLAVAFERKGESKKALHILEVLRNRMNGKLDYVTLYNMARLNGELSRDPANNISPNKQVELYELALEVNPNYPPCLHNYGKIIMETAQTMLPGEKQAKAFQIAQHKLMRASEAMKHESPLYLNTLAKSFIVQSNWSDAKKCVDQALRLQFEFPALRADLMQKRQEIRRVQAVKVPSSSND